MSFMNLPERFCNEKSKVLITPVPFESNPTFGEGASKGCFEILKSSKFLEYFDDELLIEPFNVGIRLLPELQLKKDSETAQKQITNYVKKINEVNPYKFKIFLGGDHSITPGIVKAFPDVSVLVFDAHADLRYSWNGSIHNHACVCRRISDRKIGIVGVRSLDVDEFTFIKDNENVKVMKPLDDDFERILNHLNYDIYISFDVDVFDPSIVKNTGTPEPGGFNWYKILEMLKQVFEKKNVVGFDLVEFAPTNNFRAESYTLAKLIYKIIGYKFSKVLSKQD